MIGLELLDTVKIYVTRKSIHVEVMAAKRLGAPLVLVLARGIFILASTWGVNEAFPSVGLARGGGASARTGATVEEYLSDGAPNDVLVQLAQERLRHRSPGLRDVDVVHEPNLAQMELHQNDARYENRCRGIEKPPRGAVFVGVAVGVAPAGMFQRTPEANHAFPSYPSVPPNVDESAVRPLARSL